ncbi:FecR family protein [Flexithrix dorotheae]|uniref:FecR family protein n=1 Tax=Flexithrix dorotheae TaxID=70993 RepID=UPI0003742B61|nr:FecR family protein [Flexithrix dorotheae]
MKNFEDIDELIAKKLSGEANENEKAALNSWLNQSKKNLDTFQHIAYYWDLGEQESRKDKILERFTSKVNQEKSKIPQFQKSIHNPVKTGGLKYLGWKIAAAVALIIISVITINQYQSVPQEISETGLPELVEKINPSGMRSTIKLSDGTKVYLNAASKIIIPEKFSGLTREVVLEGEAYFEVAKNPDRPFIIKSGEVAVKVLGTAFNVSAYKEYNNVDIDVFEGSIEVSGKNDKIILKDKQAVTFNKLNNKLVQREYLLDSWAWKDGNLVFKGASFAQIVKRLEQWYGVEFELQTTVDMGKGYVGEFNNKSLERVLETLSYAGDFQYKILDSKVIISKGN